jgi:hypothetical protein
VAGAKRGPHRFKPEAAAGANDENFGNGPYYIYPRLPNLAPSGVKPTGPCGPDSLIVAVAAFLVTAKPNKALYWSFKSFLMMQ